MRISLAFFLLLLNGIVFAQVVSNDLCSGAIPIGCNQTINGNTTDAGQDNVADCGTGIQAPGIWYTFTGVDAIVLLSTCESYDYDTRLNVYSGTCGALTCITGNDDIEQGVYCSELQFLSDPAVTYYILVQGYDGEVGNFGLVMSCVDCGSPQNLSASVTDTAAVLNWSIANPGSTFLLEYGPQGFTPGTGISITGTSGLDGPHYTIGGLDPSTAYQFRVFEECGPNDQSGSAGPVTFTTLSDPPASNALCSGAIMIGCDSTVMGDSSLGILTPGATCGPANITSKGLWYGFTGTGEEVTFSTCGSAGFDTKISVFAGVCNSLACAAGNDDSPGCPGNSSRLVFPSVSGVNYLVFVHGYQNQSGNFTLHMTCGPLCTPAVLNENCASGLAITPYPFGECKPLTGTLTCAYPSPEPNPDCDPYLSIADVWYSFNNGSSSTCTITLQTVSAQPISVAVYDACDMQAYVACEIDITAPLVLNGLDPDSDHFIRVWNSGGEAAGTFLLCVEIDQSIGVAENDGSNQNLIWPVPAFDVMNISTDIRGMIEILDTQGRRVLRGSINGSPSTLNIEQLDPGTYCVKHLRTGVVLGRFVKE